MSDDHIVQRWRKPAQIMSVDDDAGRVDFDAGRPTLGVKLRVHPETIERYKQGYLCMSCQEPHETPFPEKCSLCGYRMRERQREDFEHSFGGVDRDPRAVRIEKELDALDDRHERNFYVTNSGIIVPRTI